MDTKAPPRAAMEHLYFGTALALVLHQIDAAFWHEWDMFAVPGGIQGFLVFNLVAVGAVLWGYRSVTLGLRSARRWSMGCGALGIGTAALHTAFAVAGHPAFGLPLSMLTLLLCFALGVALVAVAYRRTGCDHSSGRRSDATGRPSSQP
ncbi:DUF6713 family protein [Stenotrophomonas sp.]|jgi:hypothetical protein|uniref:DUF6713 family protein n=1 Tax=Stenotrophomonas sp. TaxID=69392 RepID=UPI0028AEEEA4|nr:DUF6713 family protein [Stenotrophomonas sp.]